MPPHPSVVFVSLLLLAGPGAAVAFDTSRIADPTVRECANRALPTDSARQVQALKAIGKDGYVRESVREMMWKRTGLNDSRVVVRVREPADEQGVSVLVTDDAAKRQVQYMAYSPKFKRVRRVSGESVFGTIITSDFTYDDFAYFYRVDDREQIERDADEVLDGHPVYVLETVKDDDDALYSRVRFFIDQEMCVPVRTEFYAPNGSLRKELMADRERIEQVGERWVPHFVTMRDLKLETSSTYEVEEVEIDPALPDAAFEIQALVRGGH
jgi:hypothetical protein